MRDPTRLIIHIAGDDRLDRAYDHTGRLEMSLDPVRAVVTFLRGVGIWIYVERVVWTGLHAGLAADASIAVEVYDPVVSFVQRGDRTDGNARSVFAVVASEHGEKPASIGIGALFDVFDPGTKGANRHFVFGFAGDSAGVAADAFAMVYYKAVFHLV